ncbi:DUF4870 domain-containing protein [Neobacillus pocheonensis]|uniref:DUF4870 domain-containing protein n=1 Tax=Neobacillus pocheonensis TaxID=363869 RepID=UPI003D2C600C
MESRKVLSCLCYFSIFFAGFLFPLVVFFASGDEETKMHAKKSLLSHLIPIIPAILLVSSIVFDITSNQDQISVLTIMSIVVLVIIWVGVIIWNIVKGVKVLRTE